MLSKDLQKRSMIKIRGGYSDTKGINPYSTGIQVKEFDDRTRTILSNNLFLIIESRFNLCSSNSELTKYVEIFCRNILSNVFGESCRMSVYNSYDWKDIYENKINKVICFAYYNEVLDIIWYICNWIHNSYTGFYDDEIFSIMNDTFERESVGYRFVNGQIVQITDPFEIDEIEQAATTEFEGSRNHIQKAIEHLSNRENKDYKNVIKESISAVESICKVITGNENATLGDALKVLGKKYDLNPQLKVAFEKLFAYTNDQGGIRHADGLFTSEVTFEEAKFMLVSCSAFVNYLISEYGKTLGA